MTPTQGMSALEGAPQPSAGSLTALISPRGRQNRFKLGPLVSPSHMWFQESGSKPGGEKGNWLIYKQISPAPVS